MAVLVVVAIVVVLMWLSARGKFIFADCIVRNRGAIEEPWREFKREGNSYFLFSLLVAAIFLFVLGLATIPLWMPFALKGEAPEGVGLFVGIGLLVLVALVAVVAGIAFYLISSFMIPVMYRQRCGASAAFQTTVQLIAQNIGVVILYLLFLLVLMPGVRDGLVPRDLPDLLHRRDSLSRDGDHVAGLCILHELPAALRAAIRAGVRCLGHGPRGRTGAAPD